MRQGAHHLDPIEAGFAPEWGLNILTPGPPVVQ